MEKMDMSAKIPMKRLSSEMNAGEKQLSRKDMTSCIRQRYTCTQKEGMS
jgi:hypothetical protein